MDTASPSPPSGLIITHQHPSRRVEETLLRNLLARVCEGEGRTLGHLSVVLADHTTVLELNRTYLEHDYNTDVLAFPLGEEDDEAISGEIYIDLDTAAERHEEFRASFQEEACRYALHGLLHLMGYHDKSPEAREKMREKEDQYLEEVL